MTLPSIFLQILIIKRCLQFVYSACKRHNHFSNTWKRAHPASRFAVCSPFLCYSFDLTRSYMSSTDFSPFIVKLLWYMEIKGQLDATDWFFYCKNYCSLNMFRASFCPSSGAQDLYRWLLPVVLGALVYRS